MIVTRSVNCAVHASNVHKMLQLCSGAGAADDADDKFHCIDSAELAPFHPTAGNGGGGGGVESTLGSITSCRNLATSLNVVLSKRNGGVDSTQFGCTFTGRLISTASTCADDAAELNAAYAAYSSGNFECEASPPPAKGTATITATATAATTTPTAMMTTADASDNLQILTADLLASSNLTDNAGAPQACFGADSHGILVKSAPAVGSSFTVSITVVLQPGKTGYLFARTDFTGFRNFGLYVRSRGRGLVFFYKAVGVRPQQSVLFSFNDLNDGEPHSITLIVERMVVALFVDGREQTAPNTALVGMVDDCGAASSDCITYLGQRQGGFRMSGCLSSAIIASSTASAAAATPPGSKSGVNLLSLAGTGASAGDSSPAGAGAPLLCFSPGGERDSSGSRDRGSEGGVGYELGPFFPHQTGGRFSLAVTFAVQRGGFGYLLSKGAGGSSRYYSIYVRRSDRRLLFFYRSEGDSKQRSVILAPETAIADGTEYTLLVGVSGDAIYTTLISSRNSISSDGGVGNGAGGAHISTRVEGRLAGAAVDDCGGVRSDTCTFHIGQRNGGYRLTHGCIASATIYPDAVLSKIP